MPRGEPPASPTKCSYSFLQGMCGLHAEPGANKRKPGSGGGYCNDGTAKNPKRFSEDEAKERAAASKRKKIEATVSTRISNELDAAWTKLGKPEGALNRWLEKLAWAALKRSPPKPNQPTAADVAAEEIAVSKHKLKDKGNTRIKGDSPPSAASTAQNHRVLIRESCCTVRLVASVGGLSVVSVVNVACQIRRCDRIIRVQLRACTLCLVSVQIVLGRTPTIQYTRTTLPHILYL